MMGKNRVVLRGVLSHVEGVILVAALAAVALTGRGSLAADTPAKIRGEVGMTLGLIPAGEFLMGSTREQVEQDARLPFRMRDILEDELPQHRVKITRPFYLGITEVTCGQFLKVVRASGFKTEAEREGSADLGWGLNLATRFLEPNRRFNWRNIGARQTENHPVVNVSWNDAIAFCNELSKLEGLPPYYSVDPPAIVGGEGYRLPTEAEWEYACRAGTTTRYYCGDDPEMLPTVANIADASLINAGVRIVPNVPLASRSDGYALAAPVGQFRPNAFGLYDMHGNVGEWCWDSYSVNYYKDSPASDPTGVVGASLRVIRGGSWFESPIDVRSTDRIGALPSTPSVYGGFRVARSVPKQ